MATYVVPQVLVHQDFNLAAAATVRQLPAHISGGHAKLLRYAESDEKSLGNLGYYDRLDEVCYEWPDRPAGAVIDDDYTKVFIDDALLRYFHDSIGAGSDIQTVAGETNHVRSATVAFKENGDDFPRHSSLYDRDVQLGDTVKVRAVVGGDVYTLWSYVRGFAAEVEAAVVGAASADADNDDTQGAPANTFEQVSGPENCVAITAVDDSSYDGLEDGDINETYTIRVIASSAGNDATTATLRVTSASGNDDVAEVTPAAFGAPTAIGTRGLTVTWNDNAGGSCSVSAEADEVSAVDFIEDQEFEVTCGQAFTAPVATSGGDYTGTSDATYIIEVTKGGLWADEPEITISTDVGTDMSGPHIVSAAASNVAIGTKDVLIQFSQSGLSKGDRYYIVATAESEGAYQTIVLGHNLPEEVVDNGATECDLSLFIRKNIQVGKNRVGFAPQVNWSQSSTEVCIKDGIIAYDDSWTDDGVALALDVYSEEDQGFGQVYVEYRAWLSLLCNEVNSIFDVAALDDAISGALHPDNELKWGVFKALQNSNGVPVAYTSVCDPADPDSWLRVLELIDGRDDVYGLVPLTRNLTVWSAYQAHVSGQSSPEFGRWRALWLNPDGVEEKALVSAATSEDEGVVLATLTDDPGTSGTQYTLLKVPARNSNFVENEVRAGDIVRALYTTDGFDSVSYTEFVVDEVINEDSLRLLTGHTVAINTPAKIEVWRNLTATEQAEEIALGHGFSDRRVRYVWPDEVEMDGYTANGYFLCCCLSGLRSGIVPHQGMTRLEIAGVTSVPRTTDLFNRTQLNTLSGNGVWVVAQDLESGKIFTRHAVTTAEYDDINQREEMITTNVDSISFYFLDTFDPYIGISNVTPELITILRAEVKSTIQFLRSNNFVARLGGQLIGAEITELRPHTTLKDRVLMALALDVPYALNNLEIHLVV